ncbi:hypothetical protein PVAP13_3NG064190 [Panicum virgatum]|uniref:Uncharacterized protein n=1 Tax=Panicum virgatum TaxID=38727 RepID=A0A8T0U3A8_PANVG|nr:hypothetical protein PVAP13_3NG064190 [Panicum virgatum]
MAPRAPRATVLEERGGLVERPISGVPEDAHDGSRLPVGSSAAPSASSAGTSPSSAARAAPRARRKRRGVEVGGEAGGGHRRPGPAARADAGSGSSGEATRLPVLVHKERRGRETGLDWALTAARRSSPAREGGREGWRAGRRRGRRAEGRRGRDGLRVRGSGRERMGGSEGGRAPTEW